MLNYIKTIFKTKFQAYDICVDEEGKKCIDLYTFEEFINKDNKRPYYRFELAERIYPSNIQEEIRNLKAKMYYNIRGFSSNNEKLFVTNPIAKMVFTLNMERFKILERVYAPIVLDDICYLISYAIYVDMNTGEEYIIKMHNYGFWDAKVEANLKEQGYVHVADSKLIKSTDKVTNRSRYLKLEDK